MARVSPDAIETVSDPEKQEAFDDDDDSGEDGIIEVAIGMEFGADEIGAALGAVLGGRV